MQQLAVTLSMKLGQLAFPGETQTSIVLDLIDDQ